MTSWVTVCECVCEWVNKRLCKALWVTVEMLCECSSFIIVPIKPNTQI